MSDIRRLSDEQPPAEPSLAEWLVRLKHVINALFRQVGDWIDSHLDSTTDPHTQYMKFKGDWQAGEYHLNEVVTDQGYLAIVIADTTTARAAPQKSGPVQTDLPDLPTWGTSSEQGAIIFGTEYEILEPLWIQQLDVWIPEETVGYEFRIGLYNFTDPDNPLTFIISSPTLVPGEWNEIVTGFSPQSAGAQIIMFVEAVNSSENTVFHGNWGRAANDQSAPPAADGDWNTDNQTTELRVRYIDDEGTDRTAELDAVTAGSVVEITQIGSPNHRLSLSIIGVNAGTATSVEFQVTVEGVGSLGQPVIGALCSMNFIVPVHDTTQWVEMPGYWVGNRPTWANITGRLRLSGVSQVVPDDAFGIRIHVQPADVSGDWDYLALSNFVSTPETMVEQRLLDELKALVAT